MDQNAIGRAVASIATHLADVFPLNIWVPSIQFTTSFTSSIIYAPRDAWSDVSECKTSINTLMTLDF